MVKRLASIALFTGAAHIFTLITLKFLSQRISTDHISSIGELDSLFQFVINILAFGLQLSAVRNIAILDNWKEVYSKVQVARITLGFILIPFILLSFFKMSYQYLFLAPLFALNGDYALYARGKPVFASLLSFGRVLIPSLVLIVFSVWQQTYIVQAYIISTVVIYGVTSVVTAKRLGTHYWYFPSLQKLQLYVQSFSLGIVTMSYYFLGLGMLIIAAYFYHKGVIAVCYLGIKLYVIFKGVIRIINQAFIKEMKDEEVGLKVDQLAGFLGIAFAGAILIYPKSFITFFFNEGYLQYEWFLMVIGIAGFVSSAFTSLTTRSLLNHKDKSYAQYSVIAVFTSILFIVILSFFFQSPFIIAIGLLIGEVLMALGLIIINKLNVVTRLRFLLQITALLSLPFGIKILMGGDTYIAMISGMVLYAAVGTGMHHKKFLSFS